MSEVGTVLARRLDLKETPLALTQSVRDISVTERNAFKTCRRRWYLDTLENLEPRNTITWYYDFGTGLHTGLEAYYRCIGGIPTSDITDPLAAARAAFEGWYEETDLKIKKGGFGNAESQFRNELMEYRELGLGMLDNYCLFAQMEDTFIVCCVEGHWTQQGIELLGQNLNPPYGKAAHPILHESGRFLTPIVNPATGRVVSGRPFLSARLDLVVYERRSGWRGFWVGDHKSSTGSPSDRGIDMDDQITGYDYTFWRHTGIIPRGTFFNYLIKQLPKMPRIVRNGTALSTAKDQLTHADLYKEAMQEFGLMTPSGRITSKEHEECYASLRAQGWSRFFQRHRVTRNEHELKMFELRLVEEYKDMRDVFRDPAKKAYPHLSQYVCDGCQMGPICQAIEDGSDYESIIENRYKQAEDRKAA